MVEPTVSGQQNQRWQHFVLWDVVQRGYRVDEVKVVRIVRISIVRCPRPTYREVRKLQRGVSLMWLSRRILALRRSRTPTSATAAPKVPSGARFTEAAMRTQEVQCESSKLIGHLWFSLEFENSDE